MILLKRRRLSRTAVLLAALALIPAPAVVVFAAPAASAAVAQPLMVPRAGIFGPCNGLEDGEVRYFGRNLYVCRYVPGFGGYYWYGPIDESCAAPATVLAGKPDVRVC